MNAVKITNPTQVKTEYGVEVLNNSLINSELGCIDTMAFLEAKLTSAVYTEEEKEVFKRAIKSAANILIQRVFLTEQVLIGNYPEQILVPGGLTPSENATKQVEEKPVIVDSKGQELKKEETIKEAKVIVMNPKANKQANKDSNKAKQQDVPKHTSFKRITILGTETILPEDTKKLMTGLYTESKIDEVAKSLIAIGQEEDALNLSLDLFNSNGSLGKTPQEVEKRFFFEILPWAKGIKASEPTGKKFENITLALWVNHLNDIVELQQSKVDVIKAGVEDVKKIGCISMKTQIQLNKFSIDIELEKEVIDMIVSESKVKDLKWESLNEADSKMLAEVGKVPIILSPEDSKVDAVVVIDEPMTFPQFEEKVIALMVKAGKVSKESMLFFSNHINTISEGIYKDKKDEQGKIRASIISKWKALGEQKSASGTTVVKDATTQTDVIGSKGKDGGLGELLTTGNKKDTVQASLNIEKESSHQQSGTVNSSSIGNQTNGVTTDVVSKENVIDGNIETILDEPTAIQQFKDALLKEIKSGNKHALNASMEMWKSLRKFIKSKIKPEVIYQEIKKQVNEELITSVNKEDLPTLYKSVDVAKTEQAIWELSQKCTTFEEFTSLVSKLVFEDKKWNVAANLVEQTNSELFSNMTIEARVDWFKNTVKNKEGYNKAEEIKPTITVEQDKNKQSRIKKASKIPTKDYSKGLTVAGEGITTEVGSCLPKDEEGDISALGEQSPVVSTVPIEEAVMVTELSPIIVVKEEKSVNSKYDCLKSIKDKAEMKKTIAEFLKDRECSLEDRRTDLIDNYLVDSKKYKNTKRNEIENAVNNVINNIPELKKELA
jgi:hypothetical protein